MICPGCGLQMNDNLKYCINCGRPLIDVQSRPAQMTSGPAGPSNPVAPPQSTYQQPVNPQPANTQSTYGNANPQPANAQSTYGSTNPQLANAQSTYGSVNQQTANAQSTYGSTNPPPANAQSTYGSTNQQTANTQSTYGSVNQQTVNVQNPYRNVYQQNAYTAVPQKKKSKAPLVFAIIAIVAVLIGGCTFVVNKYILGGSGAVSDDSNDPDEDIVPETMVKQTIMIYMIGSNLESEAGLATRDLKEIKRASVTEDTNIIIQTGGCSHWDSANKICKDKKVQRFELVDGDYEELDNLGKVSMVDPDTLYDFIKFTSKKYPAEEYVLILWDHGGGIPIGYGIDELYPDDIMYIDEMAGAIKKSKVHFNSIVFDACNMCTLETCMALKGSADYLVGAESYVNGTGLTYTNWINSLADAPVSQGGYREMIVSDYMDFCQKRGMVASMSVISLGHIDAVYDAYVDYIGALKNDLENSSFSEISTARNSCGIYEYTDCVDLVTLAGKYENNASTALINTIVSAVDYTESDFSFGHGIMAYFPFDELDYYDSGRAIFDSLNYDANISDFYDELITLKYAFNYGVSDARAYAGDWFDDGIINMYDEFGVSVSEAEEFHLPAYLGDYDDGTSNYYMETGSIDWLECLCLLMIEGDDGSMYFLGQDTFSNFDDDGDLKADNPENWTYLSDRICCFVSVDYYYDEDTDEWNQSAMIPVKINGEQCYIYAFYSQDYPDGTIYGYMYDDEDDTYLYDLEDTDEIQILWYDPVNDEYVEAYDPFYASELSLSFGSIDLSYDTTYVIYQVTDVYGNIYTSDAFVYENDEFVDIVSME